MIGSMSLRLGIRSETQARLYVSTVPIVSLAWVDLAYCRVCDELLERSWWEGNSMKLVKVISGGQRGADKTGLECAKEAGLETGGTAPKGWRVDGGVDLTLKDYGLVESHSSDYPPRTHQNVSDADVTIWFGKVGSPGYWCTYNGVKKYSKVFFVNPTPVQIEYLVNTYPVWNVAGNRTRINPAVVDVVRRAFDIVKEILAEGSK